jgi:Zn-finger nucleic acid-binding protein
MHCPKCEAAFETFLFEGLELDRCSGCQGIWFDADEQQRLMESERAASVDTGSPRTGRKYNAVEGVRCPVCDVPMNRVTDSEQTHIEYETCSGCGGSFFDAGEIADLAHLSFGERLRQILEQTLSVR